MVNYSHIIEEAMVVMYKPSVIESPSGRSPEKVPDGISRVQKVAAVEKWFRGSPRYFQGIRVYTGERSRSVELRGAHEGGGRAHPPGARPPTSWPHCFFLDVHSKYPGSQLFQK